MFLFCWFCLFGWFVLLVLFFFLLCVGILKKYPRAPEQIYIRDGVHPPKMVKKIQHLWGITALICTGIAVPQLKKHTPVVVCLLTEKYLLQLREINRLILALSCMSMSNFLITTTLHNMEIKSIIISSNYQKHTHFPTGWHYAMNPLVKKKKKTKHIILVWEGKVIDLSWG